MKPFFLFMLLSAGICFGQTKKTNQTKKETVKNEKIIIEERAPNSMLDSQDAPMFDEGSAEDNTLLNASSVEVQPIFPGGEKNFYTYFSKNFHYPDDIIEMGLKGRIIASFVVEKDGSITDIKIVRGLYPSADREVLRILKSMPIWIPAEKNGKKVRCSYMLPVTIYASN